MANRKSVIPAQAQVPVAIGLAALFALILAWRFFPGSNDEVSVIPAEPAEDTQVEISLQDLTEALEALRDVQIKGLRRPSDLPSLARNPFLLAEATDRLEAKGTTSSAEGEGDADSCAQELALAARERVLSGLVLSATCVTGSSSRAIINGRHVRIGDEMEGLTVQSIGERQVTLTDDLGTHVIEIQEPLWLLDEAVQADLAAPDKEKSS